METRDQSILTFEAYPESGSSVAFDVHVTFDT